MKLHAAFMVIAATMASLVISASAQEVIGKAERVVNQISGSEVVGNRRLGKRDPLYFNERIRAGNRSHGELRLNDNSRLLVGPNSSVKLDRFVTGGRGFQSGTMRVAKGAMRFVSGRSKKGAFKVRTPLTTVGVRGTTFDIYVENGEEWVILYRGQIEVCTRSGRCQIANRSCDVIRTRSSRDISKLPFLKSRQAKSEYDEQKFKLIFDQKQYRPRWRAPIRLCSLRALFNRTGGSKPRSQAPAPGNESQPDASGSYPSTPDPEPTQDPDPDPDPSPDPDPDPSPDPDPDPSPDPDPDPDPGPPNDSDPDPSPDP